jgi:hypothetical protein
MNCIWRPKQHTHTLNSWPVGTKRIEACPAAPGRLDPEKNRWCGEARGENQVMRSKT